MSACRNLNNNPDKHRGHVVNIKKMGWTRVLYCDTCEEEVYESN